MLFPIEAYLSKPRVYVIYFSHPYGTRPISYSNGYKKRGMTGRKRYVYKVHRL